MKFLHSAILLALPSASLAFAGPRLATSVQTKPLYGFLSNLFKDRDEEDEKKVIDNYVNKKPVSDVTDKIGELLEEDEVSWEIKEDGLFGFVPTKDMTGVEPHMTRLCSTISAQLYDKESKDDFKLSTKDHKAELLIYDDHGKFKEATVPFAVVVSGDTMILGWRGTNTLADGLNDAAASPQSSLAWRKHAKTIKAQGAMTSIVQNDIVTHGQDIIEEAKKRGIKEIITTGQSLGGGAAQLGHLIVRAQIQDEDSPWSALEGVNVRSVAFCAPMSTVLLDNASDETDAFVEELWSNSCNMIYSNDVVPRGYGYLSFLDDFVDNASENLVKNSKLPWAAKRVLNSRGSVEKAIQAAKSNESVKDLLRVFSEYRQIGNVIYYESEDAKPRVLEDMGAFYKNPDGRTDVLRDVKYKHVKKPLDEVMSWHMDIIRGPGLSYPPSELSK